MKKRHAMAPEYQTRKYHFSAVWVMELSISLCLGKTEVFRIIKAWHCVKRVRIRVILVRLFPGFSHIRTPYLSVCLRNGVKWLNFFLRSGCGIKSRCSYFNLRNRTCFREGAT